LWSTAVQPGFRLALTCGVIAAVVASGGIAMGAARSVSTAAVEALRESAVVERVEFPSADGKTTLVGYLFKPVVRSNERVPAVVMMHGRAGAYSTRAGGTYDATTLSQRHQFWGLWWAKQGYLALLVDGFGPRGYPQGFGSHSYKDRPAELNEVTVRPLDAYGALTYLRWRSDVRPDRIGLQGWSNGGSATLATMATDAPGIADHTPTAGFRAALAFYPACGLKGHFDTIEYIAYAPLRLFMGTADEEVSPRQCRELLEEAEGDIESRFYKGASHDFDDPGRSRQRVAANAKARNDVIERATRFFADWLVDKQ
jgi:carboxymethylenebutenolidase